MAFDHRLEAVLEQPANDPRARAVRWWQIVDLLARAAPPPSPALAARALAAVRADRDEVDETVRTATARSIAGLRLRPELVAFFAEDKLAVTGPLLVAVQLDSAGWSEVLAAARPEVRALLAATRPEIIPADEKAQRATPPQAPLEPASISEIIGHIAELPDAEPVGAAPSPMPLVSDVVADAEERLFRWECGPSGQIDWVDVQPRGPLIGRSLARRDSVEGLDPLVADAFSRRTPFRAAPLRIAAGGDLAGEWQLSGLPAFDGADGRFAGYRGIARREATLATAPVRRESPTPALAAILHDSDAMRELVHEIRTPLNAIIGFAEIIEGQYLGPAHRHYRDRAAEILRQSRTLLEAVEDLDLAAQLQSGRRDQASGEPLGTLLATIVDNHAAQAGERGMTLKLDRPAAKLTVPVDAELGRRLVSRLLSASIAAATKGETLRLAASTAGAMATVTLGRPAVTIGHAEAELFDPSFAPGQQASATLGLGFALRLLRGLASAAGGDLVITAEAFALNLPIAGGE